MSKKIVQQWPQRAHEVFLRGLIDVNPYQHSVRSLEREEAWNKVASSVSEQFPTLEVNGTICIHQINTLMTQFRRPKGSPDWEQHQKHPDFDVDKLLDQAAVMFRGNDQAKPRRSTNWSTIMDVEMLRHVWQQDPLAARPGQDREKIYQRIADDLDGIFNPDEYPNFLPSASKIQQRLYKMKSLLKYNEEKLKKLAATDSLQQERYRLIRQVVERRKNRKRSAEDLLGRPEKMQKPDDDDVDVIIEVSSSPGPSATLPDTKEEILRLFREQQQQLNHLMHEQDESPLIDLVKKQQALFERVLNLCDTPPSSISW